MVYFFLLILIGQSMSKLQDNIRDELLKKYLIQLNLDNMDELEYLYLESEQDYPINYDDSIIDNIIRNNSFPPSYDFINAKNITPHIKNQLLCGCCWSMSSTTALAYRYLNLGIEVDLSPQYGLSCYKRDGCSGNIDIDAQMHLVKNGTVTEQCFKFTSDRRDIRDCPSSCDEQDIEFKKYYAKNAYWIEDVNPNNFYDIVTIIIDQLVTYGPVSTGMEIYTDFYTWQINQEKCHNEVYIYDGVSKDRGGHMVTIVGYGKINSTYYWLIQNSWGEICDKGFAKIGFGQVGIEQISFVEPYVDREGITPKNITVNLVSFDEKCNMEISIDKSVDKWESPLYISYSHTKEKKNFDYLCGVIDLHNTKTIKCVFEYKNIQKESLKGIYRLNESKSLGNDNKYILNPNFIKEFEYFGLKYASFTTKASYYISGKGSRIPLVVNGALNGLQLSPIYPTKNSINTLSNCHTLNINFINENKALGYCELDENELNYIIDGEEMYTKILCGALINTNITVYHMDKTKYPIFIIHHFYVSSYDSKTVNISATLKAKIEGNISGYVNNIGNTFETIISFKVNNEQFFEPMDCLLGNPSEIEDNYIINCSFNNQNYPPGIKDFNLLPYYINTNVDCPFEIVIKDVIKSGDNITPTPLKSEYVKFLYYFISLLVLLI